FAKVKADKQKQAAFDNWRKASVVFLKQWSSGWAAPKPELIFRLKDTNAVLETNYTIEADSRVFFNELPKENLKFTLPLSNLWVAAIRLEIVPQEGVEEKKMSRKKRSATAVAIAASLKQREGKESRLSIYFGDADHKQERFANGAAIIGVKDSWQIST